MIYFLVSHTHWDREWYHTAERFRQRLVPLIDELLDEPGTGGPFLLDGQTVVLEDYLDARPERAADVSSALRSGRLECGPWYVLPDELIPSGEGLTRNLLAGAGMLRALRAAAPAVLYSPDCFGHPAALPDLAREFGKTVVIVWRGRRGSRDTFWWSGRTGRVLAYHLSPAGYELGANLPPDVPAVAARWARIRTELAPRAVLDLTLLLNGADHHARQRRLPEALAALRQTAAPDEIREAGLAAFADELTRRASAASLEVEAGELRDSYGYTWTLQGTLASRAAQKRRYARCERDLLRDVEPWVALAARRRGVDRRHLMRMAWRDLLRCQPHDSLCGCSIDAVARAVDGRLEQVESQAAGLREDATLDLLGHDRERARMETEAWQPVVMLRNAAARPRSGIALVELTTRLEDVPVGPGSRAVRVPGPRAATRTLVPDVPVQILDERDGYDRTEAPRAYPDNDRVVRSNALLWANEVPAYSIAALPLASRPERDIPRSVRAPEMVRTRGRTIENSLLTLVWDARGVVSLRDRRFRRVLRGLLAWESRVDLGDLYTPSVRGPKFTPRLRRTRVVRRGPLRATLEQAWVMAKGTERIDVIVHFVLDAGAPFLRVHVSGHSAATDHRLRVVFRCDVAGVASVADAAFGPVERAPVRAPAGAVQERPLLTAPLQRYVSRYDARRGLTVYSDGLAEYEVLRGGTAVTLLRAVGELSRNDLPERPGHAGWPAATPGAQCAGTFSACFALLLHGPRSDHTIDEVERVADDALVPLAGVTLRSALGAPAVASGLTLEGAGLAFSAAKTSEDGEWLVLRCANLWDRAVQGSWRVEPPPATAQLSRLDETPLEPLAVADGRVMFDAPGRAVVTILVR